MGLPAGDYTVEYSKSNRAKCSVTKKNIKVGALRIGQMLQSPKFDGTYPVWSNYDDFIKDKKKMAEWKKRKGTLHGLSSLRWEDQERLKKDLELGGASSSEDKTPEQKALEEAYKEENKKMWEIVDQLKRNCSTATLKQILSHNDQKDTGGIDDLSKRCAYGMMFGALPRCPTKGCEDNYLVYSKGGVYRCTGATEWGKCTWSAPVAEVETTEWKIPEDIDDEYLEEFEFKKLTKVIFTEPEPEKKQESQEEKKEEGSAEGSSEEGKENSTEEKVTEEQAKKNKDDDKRPFGSLLIALSGRFSCTQKALQQKIEENGGAFSGSVNRDVDFLVTTDNDVENESTKFKKAQDLHIPCLKEEWIDLSIEMEKKLSEQELEDNDLFLWKPEKGKKRKRDEMSTHTAEELAEEEKNPKKQKKMIKIKGRSAVDPDCAIADDTHVLEERNTIWSANLNRTDIQAGINSFYIIQLLQHDKDKTNYHVFRKWGRVGVEKVGGVKLTEYDDDLDGAKKEFEDTYLDKTGNDWDDRDDFKKKPHKFYPVDVSYGDDFMEKVMQQQSKADGTDYKGALDKRVRDFISLIFDVKEMQAALVSMEIDTNKMPLGKLSKRTITEGLQALNELQELIKQKKELMGIDTSAPAIASTDVSSSQGSSSEATATTTAPAKPVNEHALKNLQNQIVLASNRFYTIVPHSFGLENPPPIDNDDIFKQKLEMLDTLRDMEIATSLLKVDGASAEDPIDQNYKKLNASIQAIDKSTEEFKILEKYLKQTHAATHSSYSLEIEDAFKIERAGEVERFKPFKSDTNRRLLWHGSRLTNWVGIISQGLRIAPPEAPVTGYMFGKGVYFADMVSKSANYCFTNPDKNTGILMLSEVALGKMYERLSAEFVTPPLQDGCLSTWGKGRTQPNPAENITIEDGIIVPLGKSSKAPIPSNASLLYNEFIVYDINQIVQKYLLRVKFNYKR